MRTAVVKARRSALDSAEDSVEAVRRAVSALDKAAEHGVLHPRNVGRRKSRLMHLLAAQQGEQQAPAAGSRQPSARGTKAKAAARKPAAARAKVLTKTERTAQRSRRAAGSSVTERD